jgi:hypothetical protein
MNSVRGLITMHRENQPAELGQNTARAIDFHEPTITAKKRLD